MSLQRPRGSEGVDRDVNQRNVFCYCPGTLFLFYPQAWEMWWHFDCFSLWLAWISYSDHNCPAQVSFLNADSNLPPRCLTIARSSGFKEPHLSLHTPLPLSSDPVVTSCQPIASSCQPGTTPRKAALGLSYFISLPNLTLTLTDKDREKPNPRA